MTMTASSQTETQTDSNPEQAPQLGIALRGGELWGVSIKEGPERREITEVRLDLDQLDFPATLEDLGIDPEDIAQQKDIHNKDFDEQVELQRIRRPAVIPTWTHDESAAGYEESCLALWNLAINYARKFSGGEVEKLPGHTKADLASICVLHVLVKAKLGALAKVPAAARWAYVCRMVWNKLMDEARRPRRHLQPLEFHDGDGNAMDSDFTLEYISGDQRIKAHEWRLGARNLEAWLDAALARLPGKMGEIVKLHFGLYRNDALDSSDYNAPQYLEAMSMNELADYCCCDCFEISRHLKSALTRLRILLLDELTNLIH
jgi:hypothetical protein